jgi:Flp pilus assembly protein TadG
MYCRAATVLRLSCRSRRAGSILPYVLAALTVLLLLFVSLVDITGLWTVRGQMQTAVEAAALAAGALLDDTPRDDPADVILLMQQGRDEAVRFAQLNLVHGQPLVLDPNPDNDPDGDIVFGVYDANATPRFQPAVDADNPKNPDLMQINAVRVTGRRTQARGNPLPVLLASPLLGPTVDAQVSALAIVDGSRVRLALE